MSDFVSKKLFATVACVALVAVSDLLGVPMDAATLDAIQNMLMSLVGAQGAVDAAAAWKAGSAVADTVTAVKDLATAQADAETGG